LTRIKDDVPAFDTFLQQYFKLGLRPEIKEPLRGLFTQTVLTTLGAACQIETEFNIERTAKTTKKSAPTNDVLFSIDSSCSHDSNRQELSNINSYRPNTYAPAPPNRSFRTTDRYEPYNRPNTRTTNDGRNKSKFSKYEGIQTHKPKQQPSPVDFKGNRPQRLECFHCKKLGHSYRYCHSATQADKDAITEDFARHRNINLNSQRGPVSSSTVPLKQE